MNLTQMDNEFTGAFIFLGISVILWAWSTLQSSNNPNTFDEDL